MPKINRINCFAACKNTETALFAKKSKKKNLTIDNGIHLTNNYKINSITQLALNLIDKLSPVIKKHPKIGKVVMSSFEQFIKVSEKFSK